MHAYHAIREIKLCHKIVPSKVCGRFESKRSDWFFQKPYCLLANHNPELQCVICTGITLFELVLHFFALVLRIFALLSRSIRIEYFFTHVIRLEMSASLSLHGGDLSLINLFDTKF